MSPITRCYPRTLRDAFPIDYRESAIGIAGPVVIRTRTPLWMRLIEYTRQGLQRVLKAEPATADATDRSPDAPSPRVGATGARQAADAAASGDAS